jgi:crotonobetainyl-CoA:carnitine CoA-transferase CaiB-like acyl-CoA transferase
MSLPLTGLKVLDLSRLLPGPYASLVLADLGATVDKVEEPGTGDYTRHMPPLKDETSALFLGLNRNKRSLALDLKSPDGVATLKRLVKHYDVLLESFRPGVMERLGCGYDTLAAENPRLVYCAITGYGHTGPDRLRAGHDLNYLARAGALGYGGSPDGAPAMPGVQIADIGGGALFALVGILAAIEERHRTGRGRFVDVSMTDGATAFLHMHLAARLQLGAGGQPLARGREALNGGYPCYGLYRTQDGRYLAVGALEPKFFQGLCAALERPDLLEGAWDTGDAGRRTRAELERIFSGRPLAEWVALFSKLDLCVEPVLEGDEVLADRQLRARGLFVEAGDVVWLRTPLRFGPLEVTPPPALGQHTAEILRECGLPVES